ncbi:hypothetical protein F5Y08DRAFT_302434 [Xylaria arbuscula]|nr:hypothetical protein F5Y08DRAFT_302434 [Xylaria arbuscula]
MPRHTLSRSFKFTPSAACSLYANLTTKLPVDHGSSPNVTLSPTLLTGSPHIPLSEALSPPHIGSSNPPAHSEVSDLAPSSTEQTEIILRNTHTRPKETPHVAKTAEFWRPVRLQRYVLYGIGGIFGFIVIGLEALFIMSTKAQGLATATSKNWHYLYTYGPTVLFTLLAAAWACVYHEAKIIAPWIQAQTRSEAEGWLLLDYISMFSLAVPFRALRNRDPLVAISALISQLLAVLVILSSSLIRVTPLDMSQPVEIRSQIIDDPSQLSRSGLRPLLANIGLNRYGLGYPEDIVDTIALQSISRPFEVPLELHATVNGFAPELDCQAAVMNNLNWNLPTNSAEQDAAENNLTVDLSVHDCNISASISVLNRVPVSRLGLPKTAAQAHHF